MKLSRTAIEKFRTQIGERREVTNEDMEDLVEQWHEGAGFGETISEWWGLTWEQYALFVENQDVFLEYVNRNLNPVEIYSIDDIEKLGKYPRSTEVGRFILSLHKETDPLKQKRLFPTNLILIKGVWELI